MASLATLGRTSARRLSSRAIQQRPPTRGLRNATQRYAANNFVMPAMSPTMTEGNITSWKVKEGDSFSAGDVLLEIETDKAQMDVEAQDDGVLAKITQQDGARSVKVGSRIAVLAEEGDDLSTLEIPAEEPPSGSPAQKSGKKSEQSNSKAKDTKTPKVAQSQPQDESYHTSSTSSRPSNDHKYSYPLYPAVEHLLHTNNISESELKDIHPTGPSGRLLKGDVLAYLNKVSKSYPLEQAARISKLEHLDLNNVKIVAPKAEKQTELKKVAAMVEEAVPDLQVLLPISLSAVYATQKKIKETLGVVLPLSIFIARASDIANDDLPRARGVVPTVDELFDAVLGTGTAKRTSRGHYTPVVTALPPPPKTARPKSVTPSRSVDIIDVLAGNTKRLSSPPSGAATTDPTAGVPGGAYNNRPIFSLHVPKEEKTRARVYLERIKTVLEVEPGRCVL